MPQIKFPWLSKLSLPPFLRTLGVGQVPTTVTTSTANVLDDPSAYYRMNSASAQTMTIPTTTKWMPGMILTIQQIGAGVTTLAAGAGVTINKAASTLVSKGQWSTMQLVYDGSQTWILMGGTN